jgi:elongation factor G
MARCFAVLGAANTGKSTLVDRMCALEGKALPPAQPGEMRVAAFTHMGEKWTALDCPGSVDFLPSALDALLAADAAVVCVAPNASDAALASPYLHMAEAAGVPIILFVNKMDEAESRVGEIAAALQDYANHVILVRQVPIRENGIIVGAVDLVSERAWKYREGGPSALIEMPSEMSEREQEARGELLEHLSEFDDGLLEELIEDRAPAQGALYAICARLFRENKFIPALMGSAGHGNGIVRVMKALRHEAPDVSVLRARLAGIAGSRPPLAVAFNASHKKHVGKTVLLRALDALHAGQGLGGRVPGQLSAAHGADGAPKGTVEAGEVVAAVKSDHLQVGQGEAKPAPEWRKVHAPVLTRVLVPTSDKDTAKLASALAMLAEDDPGLWVQQDPETGNELVGTQGNLHLRQLHARLRDVFGVEVAENVPHVSYRETISKGLEIPYRHKKQSGGAGQFADVRLNVQPAARGTGFVFNEVVKGGAVPRNYIPAVETGVREALAKGPLGFPVIDLTVTLTDGGSHAVDSSDMAFRIAGRQGTHEALLAAGPVQLQPFYSVSFYIPSVFTGQMGPLVASHRGQVLGFDQDPDAKGWDIFRATMPGSALDALTGEIRSVTQGIGYYSAEFDRYEEMYG